MRLTWAGVACLSLSASLIAAVPQKADKDAKAKDQDAGRPKLSLKAQPVISMAPSRVVLTAELTGGPNDFEEYYCPTIEWDWGDGTQSESTSDCPPYEPGKTEIKRRFTVEHVFRAGAYHVTFRMKRSNKPVAIAAVSIQVRPGLRDGER
ncbi:MAG TPA: hypothetical protein VFA59_22250 [Vicinamibacterales bacterium]|nr:hypothetical protein [Vicinamibacterales bacterium]